jgi:hypothetical protein
VTHHQQSTTAGANPVFISRRINDGRSIETATFIFNFDEDVVTQKPVANSDMQGRVSTVAVSNCVDDGFVKAMPKSERFLPGNAPCLNSRYEFVNFTTSFGHLTWDPNFPKAVALHG